MWDKITKEMDNNLHDTFFNEYNCQSQLRKILFPIISNFNKVSHNKITQTIINYIVKTKRFKKEKLLLDLKYFKHT